MKKIEMLYGFPCFAKSVTFSNFKNQKLRVSDIWGFWEYVIKKQTTSVPRKEFFKSLLEQSRYFYEAAEQAPIKSQPLLYYYSFLNLAKIIISLDKGFDASNVFQHGIATKVDTTTLFNTAEVMLKVLNPPRIISVANYFAESMGDHLAPYPRILNVSKCLESCVAIHRTYCEIFNKSESYFRLDNSVLVKNGKELIFRAEIHGCNDNVMNDLQALHYNVYRQDKLYMLSEAYTMPNYNVTKQAYCLLADQLRSKGLWYYMTGEEIRMYVSTNSDYRYSMESMIYDIMFFFGSITRYHPYFFDSILNKEQYWVVSEFLKTMPKQFLYLVSSKALGITILKSRTAEI